MVVIFLDESGFTGSNLYDLSQPVFSLASHCISEEESREIKSRFFGDYKGRDVKFSKLRRRPAGQKMILDFMSYLWERRGETRTVFAHKPFVLLCKGVDWIVEPKLRRDGINLYERGGNIAMCNMLHFLTPQVAGAAYFERMLQELQTFIRKPGRKTFISICDLLAEQTGTPDAPMSGPLADVLSPLYLSILTMHPEDAARLSASNLEFAFSLAVVMMHSWKKKFGFGMTLIHDATSAMSRQRRYWDALMSAEAPADIIGSDRRTVEFPIGIAETRFEPSEEFAGLQLADVFAGVVAECMANKMVPEEEREPFVQALWDRFQGWEVSGHIWPEAKFTPKELGTEGPAASDGMTYMGRIFRAVDGIDDE
jgi:hypothetical protein